jgi:Uma2 family endonuclease
MKAANDDAVRNFAHFLEELGKIGPDRIILTPPPGFATEADVVRLAEAPRKRLCELIDGTLVEKAVGFRECLVGTYLGCDLLGPTRKTNAGIVLGAAAAVRLLPGRVRIPDGAFYSWDRLPRRRLPEEPIPEIVPDLAFDVVKAGNTPAEMERKRADYFRAGVRLVWEIDVRDRVITTYARPDRPVVLHGVDILDAGPVLSAFRQPVTDVFDILDQHG